ncbi:hypothetical protein [Aliivibrio fischeri]|uniref:hypothetical protein n=1 Tax=Aliivibrio fischeri TaxID=668 RepID=UPI00105C825A|nr:hypothetical protein [Aliivibrio fischeri]TDM51519.1 hypothetical protein VFFQA001_15505 [Aliivibrio fischeri]
MSKNIFITFKSDIVKASIQEFEIDEELIALHKGELSISPSIRLIPTDKNTNKYIAQDIIEGFLTDQFSVVESKVIESEYFYHIKVLFQFSFEDFINVTLSDSELLYTEGDVEYYYHIEGSFCKAFAFTLTQNINTDFPISVFFEEVNKMD